MRLVSLKIGNQMLKVFKSKTSFPTIQKKCPLWKKTKIVGGVLTSLTRGDSLTIATEKFVELPFDAMVEANVGILCPLSSIHDKKPDSL